MYLPPIYSWTETRFDVIERAMHEVIVMEGAAAVSVRRVARACRLGASTLLEQYSSKQRLLQVVALRAAKRRRQRVEERLHDEGILAFVPHAVEELGDEIVWRALVEHGRTDENLAEACAIQQADDRKYLAWITGRSLSESELDGLEAMIEGIGVLVSRSRDPLPSRRAEAALGLMARRYGIVAAIPRRRRVSARAG